MKDLLKEVAWQSVKLTAISAASMVILFAGYFVYQINFSQEAYDKRVYKIYAQIIAATGQGQEALPLRIEESNAYNAHNDGTEIVINRGVIDQAESWDEVALVLGHETAHGMLGHLGKLSSNKKDEIIVLEANADKMGAFYMMKAGYNICKARIVWKRFADNYGNALNQDHPNSSYRYDELKMPWCSN